MFPSSFIIVLLTQLTFSECANILYLLPYNSKSHYFMLRPIGLELARRGHNVTVITGNKEDDALPNYHQIVVEPYDIWKLTGYNGGDRPNVFTMREKSAEEFHKDLFWEGGLAYTEKTLNSTAFKKFIDSDNSFDLVINEQFFQDAYHVLAHKYNAPLVLVTTFGNCMRHNIVARNPLQLATVISEFLDVKDPNTFLGRLRNFYFTVYEYVWWRYWFLEKQEQFVKKYIPKLPEPVPSLYELEKNASLFLVNSHFSFDAPMAYLPNIVEVGGLHITRSTTKLPEDLQKILDNAKEGVVYVNFGSNVRSSELPVDKKNAFIKIFSELNHTVLWKWEDDTQIKANNLITRKWFPQKEVLSHPNIKLFISHGGLIGTQDSMYRGIPIIGIPIYGDQYNNLLQAQEIGFGKILQFDDINEDNLRKLINEVLDNDKYKKKAEEVSARFKDRPLPALDTAMFWIEYIIRNKGADFMKNPALKLDQFAYQMLDVYAFVLIVLILTIYLLFLLLTSICRVVILLFNKNHEKKHKEKRK